MPKSKTLKTRCVKNIKSGRCTLSEVEDETSKDCLYNEKTKRCTNKVTKKRVPANKRGPAGTMILGKNVNKNVVPYLEKLVYKKSAAVIRQNNSELEYPIPLDPDDNKMKLYLLEEILQLAYYADMDYGTHGKGPISLKMIKLVLQNDEELNMILK